MSKFFRISMFLVAVLLFSCGGGGGSKQVTVSWSANKDKVVNMTGGGYTLYYSQQSSFDINSASKTDVSYVSGSTAPISTKLVLAGGVWFIRIAAYGIVNGIKKTSDPSEQIAVNAGG